MSKVVKNSLIVIAIAILVFVIIYFVYDLLKAKPTYSEQVQQSNLEGFSKNPSGYFEATYALQEYLVYYINLFKILSSPLKLFNQEFKSFCFFYQNLCIINFL